MSHPLDRPVWASLTTVHQPLSEGTPWARRFDRQVNVFAAARDDSEQALAALADMVQPGERIYLLQVPEIAVPLGLRVVKQAIGVQMMATRSLAREADLDGIAALGETDAPDMLALAQLTEPGPFFARTHRMGSFIGIREGGRLLGMAGERLRLPGYTEVSGVCTHPDARGRGFARRLSAAVGACIEARSEQPFLHAWSSNTAAIALYESLGFVRRVDVHVALLERPVPTSAR